MITYVKSTDSETDYINLLKNKKIHVVSCAYFALNYGHEYLRAVIDSQDLRFELVSKICRTKETGTLYPVANLTLIPVEYLHYPVMGGECISVENYSREEFEVFILDAFKAETENVKSGKMVFDFRDKQINVGGKIIVDETYYKIVEEMIHDNPSYEAIDCRFLL